jgi:hypothetical protein
MGRRPEGITPGQATRGNQRRTRTESLRQRRALAGRPKPRMARSSIRARTAKIVIKQHIAKAVIEASQSGRMEVVWPIQQRGHCASREADRDRDAASTLPFREYEGASASPTPLRVPEPRLRFYPICECLDEREGCLIFARRRTVETGRSVGARGAARNTHHRYEAFVRSSCTIGNAACYIRASMPLTRIFI